MRFQCAGRPALLLILLAPPLLLRAQFQAPTPDELKMTADPKAPGAAAVYLYREETTDDTLHFHSYYERIKVLTEKGKELATIRTPYERGNFSVKGIEGRTIHADGTVIPLTTKPADLMDFKTKTLQINTMVFTLPSVEVGSILEYRLQIRYDDSIVSSPTWNIQQPYFVRKAHYFFRPASNGRIITNDRGDTLNRLMYSTRLDSDAKVEYNQANKTYSLDVNDVPALPDDDWMPPLNTIKWRVEFYYTNFATGLDFWQTNEKRWSKEADEFTKTNGALKKIAADIVADANTDSKKALKLYTAVQKLDNSDFTRRKSEAERKKEKIKAIKNAEDVWKQQSGSSDDIALLYVALARAAGLKAWPMQVINRNRAIFDAKYLSVDQFDDYIAIVELNGKEVFLDPGQKLCTFGDLHWKHTFTTGFRQTDKGPGVTMTPANTYQNAVIRRLADLEIAEDGGVKGSIRIVMTGPDALLWRQRILENDEDEVKKQFNEYLHDYLPEGVEGTFDHFLGLEDYNANLLATVQVSGNLGSSTGKRFFLPGLFFESRARHPFVAQDKRTSPIDVHYAKMEVDDVTYHLPAGLVVESAPQAENTTWPGYAVLNIVSVPQAEKVTITRTFAHNFTLIAGKDYSSLHDFYIKVAAADQQQLVLTRGPAVKGN